MITEHDAPQDDVVRGVAGEIVAQASKALLDMEAEYAGRLGQDENGEDEDVTFAVAGAFISAAVHRLGDTDRTGHAVSILVGILDRLMGQVPDKPYKQEKQRQKAARKLQRRHR